MFIAVSCTIDTTIDQPVVGGASSDCQFRFEARATRFDDYNVTTRANKTAEEAYVSSMALVVFPVEDGVIQPCISYARLSGDNLTFTIDRKQLRESLVAAGEDEDRYNGVPFALYIFANMDLPATFGELSDEQKKLDWYLKYYHQNTNGIRRPQNGFPMYGSLGDFVTEGADGKKFILMPSVGAGKADVLPTVNGTPSDYIPIPMTALYAKHSFSIRIEPDQELNEGIIPMFTMTGYEVHNIPAGAGIDWSDDSENKAEAEKKGVNVLEGPASITFNGSAISNATIDFEFYLPERLLDPATSAEAFEYPFGKDGKVTGYSNVRPEDQRYCQRYKEMLLGGDQQATYITISGQFRNHQGHTYDVDYKIYLGANNYGDFNIKRNAHYINKIVLRGITASSDQSVNQDGFFVDHRVNVERSLPIIVNLQRETKLDSHFEVRPLRIRYPLAQNESLPTGAKVVVEVQGKTDGAEWVRLEHNNGGTADNTYCASGKRRYFTTNLVTSTLQTNRTLNGHKVGSKIEIPLSDANQETVWIYIDQCDEIGAGDSNSRQAIISVTYSDDKGAQAPHKYTLNQYKLYPVTTNRSTSDVQGTATASGPYTYYIEHEEEYLYNFDSDDNYGQTEQAGMKWGLEGIQLSHKTNAIDFNIGKSELIGDSIWDYLVSWIVDGLTKWLVGNKTQLKNEAIAQMSPKPYYDFYMPRDMVDMESGLQITSNSYNGYSYNTDIAAYLRSSQASHQGKDATGIAKIDGIALDEQPKSAFAYCHNKNKRNENGVVDKIEWYLPAIDEIEDIAEIAYGDFGTVFQGNLYWSCQPAYIKYDVSWTLETDHSRGYGSGPYFVDNKVRARATRALLGDDNTFQEAINSGDKTYKNQNGLIHAEVDLWRQKVTGFDVTIPVAGSETDPVGGYDTTYKDNPGNLSRSDYARVRCVRVKPTN